MVPEVKKCSVTQCFYNRDSECFAHAILVGSSEPVCETFMQTQQHTPKNGQSEVGACHVDQCVFNDLLSCHACDDIEVKWSGSDALCATFRQR